MTGAIGDVVVEGAITFRQRHQEQKPGVTGRRPYRLKASKARRQVPRSHSQPTPRPVICLDNASGRGRLPYEQSLTFGLDLQ